MQALIQWIMGTSASKTIANVAWIIPAVQTIHILAISVVISTMAMLDLRLLGLTAKRYTIRAVADRFLPWMWLSVIVLLITGVILITGEPDRALGNWVFQTKMALLIAVLAISWGFNRVLKRDLTAWDRDSRHKAAAKVTGLVSLLLWIGIVVCGRWIAYAA
jgi:uncharacterized membrane protein